MLRGVLRSSPVEASLNGHHQHSAVGKSGESSVWTSNNKDEQKNALLAKLAQEEQLVQELRATERRVTATVTKTQGEVADLALLVQSERQQTEETKTQSRKHKQRRFTKRKSEP